MTIETKELKISEELKRNVYMVCMTDKPNTTILNGKMVMRIMTNVSQNEIEKCFERIKFGMVVAIKSCHIPNRSSMGFKRKNKKLVPDSLTKHIVVRVFNLYLGGKFIKRLLTYLIKIKF